MKVHSGNGTSVDVAAVLSGLPEGKRDDGLFRYACRLREKNLGYEEAKLLVLSSAVRCKPPFSEEEALKKLDQAWKYEPSSTDFLESLGSPKSPESLECSTVTGGHQRSPESHQVN